MKYDYRYISTERCQEINNMKIPSPLPPYYPEFFVMESEGKKYFSSEDENLIFTAAFIPIPADREFYQEHYLLIKDNGYFIFNYKRLSNETVKIDNAIYADIVFEILPNDKIDNCNEKDEVLHIISEMIKKSNVSHFNIIIREKILYKGKEIK